MDGKDRRILYEVSENARESHNVLARKLKISREVLDYRLKKLKDTGIITGYQARINISNFIYGGYIFLIQTIKSNLETELSFLNKLKNNGNTQYVGKIAGSYDYIIGMNCANILELASYSDFINNTFGPNKSKITLLTMVEEIKDSFKGIFSDIPLLDNFVSMPQKHVKKELDDIDKKIISILSKDCTTPSWKISESTKLTPMAIRKRIKKLQEDRIILNYRTMIDLTKFDLQPAFLFIKINSPSSKEEEDFKKYLSENKKITYATKIIGEYDYVATLLNKDNKELYDDIQDLRNKFSNIVINVDSFNLFEMQYHTQLAKDLLK